MRARRLASFALAAAVLLAFGLARLPLEESLASRQVAEGLRQPPVRISLREHVTQMALAAALGGFRSLAAAFVWIEAHTAWEETDWPRMLGLLQSATVLAPRSIMYWDLASWHMAWNASRAALDNPDEPSELRRRHAEREYQEIGRGFIERGIANNPQSSLLQQRLGALLSQKFGDHCAAAEAYARAAALPDAPPYVKRQAAYEMAACPGHEREAYGMLKAIYQLGGDERQASVVSLLRKLEVKLDIPPADRIRP